MFSLTENEFFEVSVSNRPILQLQNDRFILMHSSKPYVSASRSICFGLPCVDSVFEVFRGLILENIFRFTGML